MVLVAQFVLLAILVLHALTVVLAIQELAAISALLDTTQVQANAYPAQMLVLFAMNVVSVLAAQSVQLALLVLYAQCVQ